MKNWQLWEKGEEGFWGDWTVVETTDLPDAPYWVIPNRVNVEADGLIDGDRVCSGSASAIESQLPAWSDKTIYWYLVLNKEVFPIGRWGLSPGFLEDYVEEPIKPTDEEFFKMGV